MKFDFQLRLSCVGLLNGRENKIVIARQQAAWLLLIVIIIICYYLTQVVMKLGTLRSEMIFGGVDSPCIEMKIVAGMTVNETQIHRDSFITDYATFPIHLQIGLLIIGSCPV